MKKLITFLKYLTSSPCRHKSVFPKTVLPEGDGVKSRLLQTRHGHDAERTVDFCRQHAAETHMATEKIDLVICMPAAEDNSVFDIARSIKHDYPAVPIVVLTPFSHGITRRMQNEDLSAFEYVFCWLGNTELLLSIIKLMEDRMNLEHDIRSAGVQMILLV